METREEILINAYGKDYDYCKPYIQECGRSFMPSTINRSREKVNRDNFKIFPHPSEFLDCQFKEVFVPLLLPKNFHNNNGWTNIKEANWLPPQAEVVFGWSIDWEEDGNPSGVRECFYNGNPKTIDEVDWVSAKWDSEIDEYSSDRITKPTHVKILEISKPIHI